LIESGSPAQFLARLSTSPVVVDQWQLEKLALVFERNRVLFYVPGLPPEYRARLWGPSYDSAPEAVTAFAAALGSGAAAAVLPEGPYVFARPKAREAELAVR